MEALNIGNLVNDIMFPGTWIILIIAVISGMLGGIAHKLTSPPGDNTSWLKHLVVGAVASLAVLFVFTPLDAIRLIAQSVAAGYGGKAVLDALEARVKTALAEKKTADTEKERDKAINVGDEAVKYAQNLSQVNEELMKVTKQPRETILESLKAPLPADLYSFAAKSPKDVTDELKRLSNRLEFLKE